MLRTSVLVAALATIACSAASAADRPRTGEEALARALEGRAPGKPVDCIWLRRVRDSRVIDGTAIIFNVGGVLYVNKPASGGELLSDSKALLIRMQTSELCRGQAIQLFDPGANILAGFETLGEFVPYRKSRTERESPSYTPMPPPRASGY